MYLIKFNSETPMRCKLLSGKHAQLQYLQKMMRFLDKQIQFMYW